MTEYLEDKKKTAFRFNPAGTAAHTEDRNCRREILKKAPLKTHYNVTIKSVPGCKILSLRKTVADYYCEGEAVGTALCLCEGRTDKTEPRQLTILPFITNGGTTEDGVDIEVGVMVEREGADKGRFLLQGDRGCGGYGLYYGLWSI